MSREEVAKALALAQRADVHKNSSHLVTLLREGLSKSNYPCLVNVIDFIDRTRYPIDEPQSAITRDVIERARQQIAETGAAELSGFITPEGVAHLVADAESLAERAHPSGGMGTAWLEPLSEEWPEGHPRRHRMKYGVRAVGYDVIPYTSPLRQLYELEDLTAFVAAVLQRGPIYHYADPCGALNLAVMAEGDELQWHYDQTDFVVSLAIQDAAQGGDFEMVPKLRERDDEHYDRVSKVFEGDHSEVVTLAMTPGTLLIFEGRNSLHRVSPIHGDTLRHVGLFAYDTKPDTVSNEHLRNDRYGRRIPFSSPPELWPAS